MSSPTTIGRISLDKQNSQLSTAQNTQILYGQNIADDLKERAKIALGHGNLKSEPFKHYYIASPAGGGKTHTLTTLANELGVNPVKVQGATSISALIRHIALAAYLNQGNEIIVLIDDCDIMFHHPEGQEVMKGALDADRNVMTWNKVMSAQIKQLETSTVEQDHILAEALRFYTPMNEVGISIPTDNIRFITLSNHQLATSSTNPHAPARKINESAIRDRMNYKYYHLTPQQNWGWVAHILLTSDFPKVPLTLEQKYLLLDWMWYNLDNLTETSLRAVMNLGSDMINYPGSYKDKWALKVPQKQGRAA